MAFSIDGNSGWTNDPTGTGNTLTLTTTKTRDIIILFVVTQGSHLNGTPATVSDTAGLVWTNRTAQISADSTIQVEEWYAYSPDPLPDDQISVIPYSHGPTVPSSDTAIAFGVSGADVINPWDTNASLPDSSTGDNNSPSNTFSTSASTTMLLQCVGFANGGQSITQPSGFTALGLDETDDPEGGAAYEVVSSAQSDVTTDWSLSASATWVTISDALRSSTDTPIPGLTGNAVAVGNDVDSVSTTSEFTGAPFPAYEGSLILVVVSIYGGGTPSISDSDGNSYTLGGSHTNSGNSNLVNYWYYAIANVSDPSVTLTCDTTENTQIALTVGVLTGEGSIVAQGSWSDSHSASDSCSATASVGNSLVVFYSNDGPYGPQTASPDTWVGVNGCSSTNALDSMWCLLGGATAGTNTMTATTTGSRVANNSMLMVVLAPGITAAGEIGISLRAVGKTTTKGASETALSLRATSKTKSLSTGASTLSLHPATVAGSRPGGEVGEALRAAVSYTNPSASVSARATARLAASVSFTNPVPPVPPGPSFPYGGGGMGGRIVWQSPPTKRRTVPAPSLAATDGVEIAYGEIASDAELIWVFGAGPLNNLARLRRAMALRRAPASED